MPRILQVSLWSLILNTSTTITTRICLIITPTYTYIFEKLDKIPITDLNGNYELQFASAQTVLMG